MYVYIRDSFFFFSFFLEAFCVVVAHLLNLLASNFFNVSAATSVLRDAKALTVLTFLRAVLFLASFSLSIS